MRLPPFNPYEVLFLYLKRRGKVILKWSFLLLGAGLFLTYGFFLYRQLSLRVNLKREIKEPSRFYILLLRKKYEKYLSSPSAEEGFVRPRQVFYPAGDFLFSLGKLLEKTQEEGETLNFRGKKLNVSQYLFILSKLLAFSRYKAMKGKGESSWPTILALFTQAYSRRWPVVSREKSRNPFPCSALEPRPFELLSLSIVFLHVSLVRFMCLGEKKQLDYIYDLYQGAKFFSRYLEAKGVEAERKAVLQRWGGWRLLLPWGRFYNLALPLSQGSFLERDEDGFPCPYPYNLYHQRRVLSLYFLTAQAFSRARGRGGEGMGISPGAIVRVKRSGKLLLVKFPLEGRSLLLVQGSPLQCDSSLSFLLQEVTAPALR